MDSIEEWGATVDRSFAAGWDEGLRGKVEDYLRAWNDHDPNAIVATFAQGGTYTDPGCAEPVSGEGIARSAGSLFEGFPDLEFKKMSVGLVGPGRFAVRWLMRGTHLGPFSGLPPTGRSVCLPGADFIEVGSDGILSVEGYYDRQIVSDQLGLRTTAVPESQGPFRFGIAVSVHSGRVQQPGGFSLTRLGVRSKDGGEPPSVWPVLEELPSLPGFLSVIAVEIGGDNYTITAWERPEDAAQMRRLPSHRAAMKEFYSGTADIEGWTSIWSPALTNSLLVRCTSCWQIREWEAPGAKCPCGASLPDDTRHW